MDAELSITATSRHQRATLVRVAAAAKILERAETELKSARERRDIAVRSALGAGCSVVEVAGVAGVSNGLVSRIRIARRG